MSRDRASMRLHVCVGAFGNWTSFIKYKKSFNNRCLASSVSSLLSTAETRNIFQIYKSVKAKGEGRRMKQMNEEGWRMKQAVFFVVTAFARMKAWTRKKKGDESSVLTLLLGTFTFLDSPPHFHPSPLHKPYPLSPFTLFLHKVLSSFVLSTFLHLHISSFILTFATFNFFPSPLHKPHPLSPFTRHPFPFTNYCLIFITFLILHLLLLHTQLHHLHNHLPFLTKLMVFRAYTKWALWQARKNKNAKIHKVHNQKPKK